MMSDTSNLIHDFIKINSVNVFVIVRNKNNNNMY